MANAIILHGRPTKAQYYSPDYPSESNAHWLPWLQNQLIIRDIQASTPEISHAYEPLWERWVKEVERFDIDEDTILVGHSCGGGFWVRYLSQHRHLKVGLVVLVAPWIDVENEDPNHFFNFNLNTELALQTKGLHLVHSSDDVAEIQSSVAKLRKELHGATYHEFENRGHFTHRGMPEDGSFPELLDIILTNRP